jgi:hypothetical protein
MIPFLKHVVRLNLALGKVLNLYKMRFILHITKALNTTHISHAFRQTRYIVLLPLPLIHRKHN